MSYTIGIYQNHDSNFSDIICSALNACEFDITICNKENANGEQGVISVFTVECAALLPDFLDICILESGYQKSNSFPHAETVIVPDICSVSTISQLSPKSVVTYGLSCKNTVTVSSLIEKRLIVSVQREIVSLTGKRTVEQEFFMDVENHSQIEAILASVALLLLLGVQTERIKDLSFTHSKVYFTPGSDIFS